MKELNKLTIWQASKLLKEKEISSEELVKAVFEKIKKLNKKLNAYITILEKEGIESARESDKRRFKNQAFGDLDGIPLAIKDVICIKDTLTTCGSKILSDFISPFDATVIRKFKNAGVVFLGKTNMDEFAMGSSTETSYFGPTKNPWDLSRVPGGSSGGSAAAVAAGMCLGALGSDTGGSIRQPAAFCGVVGLKPTYGAVSRYGLIAMASSLDQIGPITKTVEDAEILYQAIAGYDELDSTSTRKNQKSKIKNQNYNLKLKNIKIGIPKEYFIKGMDKGVEETVKKAIEKLEELGAKIVEVSLPHTPYALAVYYLIMPSEVSSNLARYDGIKYGYSKISNLKSQISNLMDVYLKSRAEGFGEEPKRRIMLGTFALSSGYYEAYYLKAKKVQAKIKEDFDRVFQKVDCLVTPTSSTVAFKIGEKTEDPLTMYLSDIFTISVNLAGLPAISIPCGFVRLGSARQACNLPVGLQIIGKQFDEETILKTAYIYEQNTEWHKQKPKL